MTSIIPDKRLIIAQCKLCGRVYWSFSDEQPFDDFEYTLRRHLEYKHVSRGDITEEALNRNGVLSYYKMIYFRAYDPSKVYVHPESMAAIHPELIPLEDYEALKMMSKLDRRPMIKLLKHVMEMGKF